MRYFKTDDLSWKSFFRFRYFWTPVLLAIVDLTFYVLVPILLIATIKQSELGSGLLIDFIHNLYQLAEINPWWGGVTLISIISLSRILIIRGLETIFSKSLSLHYKEISDRILTIYLNSLVGNAKINKSKLRKVLNAELNNVFFGFLIPMAFGLAEFLLVLIALFYGTYLFGVLFVLSGLFIGLILFFILFLIRKRAKLLGFNRSNFEQKRLKAVELALDSGFSISINGGDSYLKHCFSELTGKFAKALSAQVILPFSTKALVDGALVIFILVIVYGIDFNAYPEKFTILGGMALRILPSLSRISTYMETIRINTIALKEINSALFIGSQVPEVTKHLKLFSKLESLPDNGLHVVIGASGVGKTTTIKQWVSLLRIRKSVAFLEQNGVLMDFSIKEYLKFMGFNEKNSSQIINTLSSYGIVGTAMNNLSGGEAKFLQFLALANKRVKVYIFDEPSVGLDVNLRKAMLKIINKLSNIALVVVVSHDKSFIKNLIKTSDGKLIDVK